MNVVKLPAEDNAGKTITIINVMNQDAISSCKGQMTNIWMAYCVNNSSVLCVSEPINSK